MTTQPATPAPVQPPRNVIDALARVAAEIGGIEKLSPQQRAQRGMGGGDQGISYRYRGIDQIASEAQPLFGKYGVVIVPTVLDREAPKIVKGNTTLEATSWYRQIVEVRWDIYGPGGVEDHIFAVTIGVGDDNSDKGMNKAMTAAYKNLLLRILCIGDPQDDTDNFDTRDTRDDRSVDRPSPIPADHVPTPRTEAAVAQWQAGYARMKPKQKTALMKYGQTIGVTSMSDPGAMLGAMLKAMNNLVVGREPGEDAPMDVTPGPGDEGIDLYADGDPHPTLAAQPQPEEPDDEEEPF